MRSSAATGLSDLPVEPLWGLSAIVIALGSTTGLIWSGGWAAFVRLFA